MIVVKELKTISREKVKEVFGITNSSTIKYIKDGILRVVGKYSFEDTTFDYRHICDVLGLKKIPNEPLLTTEDVIPLLGLSHNYYKGGIRKYCDSHKIPYYCFSNVRGTKTYFLRSEVEAAIKYTIQWGTEFPRYVMGNHILRETFKTMLNPVFCKSLNKNERNMMMSVIINGDNIRQGSIENRISIGTASMSFINGCKKVLFAMKSFNFNATRMQELAQENAKLEIENDILSDKLNVLTQGQTPMERQNIDYLAKSFSDSGLSVRMYNALKRIGVNNLYELSNLHRSDVEKFQNIGQKTIDGLEGLLQYNNLGWKPEPKQVELIIAPKAKKVYNRTPMQPVRERLEELDIKSRLDEIEKKLDMK